MKMYVLSLGAGLLVGVLYGLLNVRSPAPPIIALIGLLGILAGEQIPTLVRHYFDKQPAATSWHEHVKPHMFGHLPRAPKLAGNSPPHTDGKAAAPIARDPNA